MTNLIKQTVILLSLIASGASAQTNPPRNIFFGFDFVLQPIAIKWACGGPRDHDLAAIEALIAAFPKDAELAGLKAHLDAMTELSEGKAGLSEVLGGELARDQAERLCGAAKTLSIAWATPEQIANDDEEGSPPEQRAAWEEFWRVVEGLQ
jgi:hypothetical protein